MDDGEDDTPSDPRFYALRDATFGDRPEALKLIEIDPSIVSAKSSIGETALHYLVVENYLEAVEFLAQNGSDVNTRNAFDDPAINDAVQLGYVEMVDLLLRLGAEVDVPRLLEKVVPSNQDRINEILKSHGVVIE